MLCFGTVTEPSRFSTSMQSTLRSPSSQASASPTGPPPTMMTEVLASLIVRFRVSPFVVLSALIAGLFRIALRALQGDNAMMVLSLTLPGRTRCNHSD
jgi:hypothetical protein